MRFSFLVLIFVCAASSIAQSTQPVSKIDELIAQLSNDNWKERQTAQERLVQLGDESAEALKSLQSSTSDPEARSLAETALAQIEQNRMIGASIITIRGDNLSPRDAFRQLAEQAGARLEPIPPNLFASIRPNRISLDIDHQTFWAAMNELTAKTGVTIINVNNQMMLTTSQSAIRGPMALDGPYMVMASSILRSRSMDLASNASSQQFSVQLTVMAEPKMRVIRASAGAKIDSAVDENGLSLARPSTASSDLGYYGQMGNSWQVTVPLKDSDAVGTRIAMLKGSVSAVICTRMDRVEIPDIMGAKSVEKVIDGVRVTLVDVVRKNDSYELRLRAKITGADRDWSQLPIHAIRLFDARGAVLPSRGSNANITADTYELVLQFAAIPANGQGITEPANLVWEIPLETRSVEIPFEFKEIPIP